MPAAIGRNRPARGAAITRRRLLLGLGAAAALGPASASAAETFSFGLTPVFLDNDIELLSMLERYLTSRLRRPVALVKRRTYQEISAMLISGQLDAAWICDDPYVQYRNQLTLLAVPSTITGRSTRPTSS
jgi:phosphonate transport system substrate-binding protein